MPGNGRKPDRGLTLVIVAARPTIARHYHFTRRRARRGRSGIGPPRAVEEEVDRGADTVLDGAVARDAEHRQAQAAVDDEAHELLGGLLEIVAAQLGAVASERGGDGANAGLPAFRMRQPPELRPALGLADDDAVEAYRLRRQRAGQQMTGDLEQHRLELGVDRLKAGDRHQPTLDQV